MRPQSMSMLGVFAMIDLLAMFALFSEPSTEPDSLALGEPPADIVGPLLAEDALLTAQHKEFLNELRDRVDPGVGPSDDEPMPVPVHHDKRLEGPSEDAPNNVGELDGAGGSDVVATSVVGI